MTSPDPLDGIRETWVLAYLDRGVTAAIVGALSTLAAGASPQLLQRAAGDAPRPPGAP